MAVCACLEIIPSTKQSIICLQNFLFISRMDESGSDYRQRFVSQMSTVSVSKPIGAEMTFTIVALKLIFVDLNISFYLNYPPEVLGCQVFSCWNFKRQLHVFKKKQDWEL